MKTIAASIFALGLLVGTAQAANTVIFADSPANVRSGYTSLQDAAPRSVFTDLQGSAPRSIFTEINETAPLQDGFLRLERNAP